MQINNAGEPRHAKWRAARDKTPNMVPACKLPCRLSTQLNKHDTESIIMCQSNLAAFIVCARHGHVLIAAPE